MSKIKKEFSSLIFQIIAAGGGFYLAAYFIPEVSYGGKWMTLVWAGLILGLLNFFLRPAIRFLTTPLRMITFGLFSIIINGGMVWLTTAFLDSLQIPLIAPLFYTTFIIGLVSLFLNLFH